MSTIALSLPPLGENIQSRSLAPEVEHLQRLELIRVYRWIDDLFQKEPQLLCVRHRSSGGVMYLVLDESHAHKSQAPEKVIEKIKVSIDEVNEAIRQSDNMILRYILEDQHALNQSTAVVAKPKKSPRL